MSMEKETSARQRWPEAEEKRKRGKASLFFILIFFFIFISFMFYLHIKNYKLGAITLLTEFEA